MAAKKVIPCLDVKDGKLVKGVHFVDLKELGDPAEAAAAYSEAGADEVVFLDIAATLENRKTMLDAVKRTVEAASVPVTVGGGIRTVHDIDKVLGVGATKVSINTAAFRDPDMLIEAAGRFGCEAIVVAVDTRANEDMPSGHEVMLAGGTQATGQDAAKWARDAESYGAGAILPTSMDADGTQDGYDIPMTRAIADATSVPVIASGGAGELEHLSEAILEGHADAVLVASIAHYGKFTIRQMKEHLASKDIEVHL